MGNPYYLTMYGSNGHMAPIVMGGDRTDGPGTFTFTMGDIGVFSAMKILCSGNDGWLIDDLTMQISNSAGVESQAWPYYQWIDGDGHRQEEHDEAVGLLDGEPGRVQRSDPRLQRVAGVVARRDEHRDVARSVQAVGIRVKAVFIWCSWGRKNFFAVHGVCRSPVSIVGTV